MGKLARWRLILGLFLLLAVLALAAQQWLGRSPMGLLSEAVAPLRASSEPLRKCLRGSQVEYTNGACPPGTREQAVSGGSLSVLPAAPKPPAEAASPALRELAQSVDGTEMREKRMQQVIGR